MAQDEPQPCTGPKQDLIPFLKGGKWGFCDRDKKLVIPAVFDDAYAFGTVPLKAEKPRYPTPDVAYVRKGKKEFWINSKGETRRITGEAVKEDLQRIYEVMEFIRESNYTSNGKQGYIMKGGRAIPPIYDTVSLLPNGDFYVELNGKAGVMDSCKNWIVPMEFENIAQVRFRDESYPVYSRGYKVMKDERWGLIVAGKSVIPVQYKKIEHMFGDWYKVQNENGAWCLLDANGRMMGSIHEELGNYDGEFDRMAVKDNGKWGFIDRKGKVQIVSKYSEVSRFHNVSGLAVVNDGKRSFFIDCTGTEYRSE